MKNSSPDSAWKCLQEFIFGVLIPRGSHSWTQQAVIILLWIAVGLGVQTVASEKFGQLLTDIHANWKPLEGEAAQGVLVVGLTLKRLSAKLTFVVQFIWSQLNNCASNGENDVVTELCRIALHPLFAQADESHLGKFCR